MSKGKKFTAAEKHFEKKRIAMQSEINQLKSAYTENYKTLEKSKIEMNTLKSENEKLKEWIERLLEYTKLSEEEIKQVCEAEKRKEETLQAFNTLMKAISRFS